MTFVLIGKGIDFSVFFFFFLGGGWPSRMEVIGAPGSCIDIEFVFI